MPHLIESSTILSNKLPAKGNSYADIKLYRYYVFAGFFSLLKSYEPIANSISSFRGQVISQKCDQALQQLITD
jgi:hypothetical protein